MVNDSYVLDDVKLKHFKYFTDGVVFSRTGKSKYYNEFIGKYHEENKLEYMIYLSLKEKYEGNINE
jgi:hypothetical protein